MLAKGEGTCTQKAEAVRYWDAVQCASAVCESGVRERCATRRGRPRGARRIKSEEHIVVGRMDDDARGICAHDKKRVLGKGVVGEVGEVGGKNKVLRMAIRRAICK